MQVVKMRSEFRSMALVCTTALGLAGGAARAEYPSQDIISLNISNYSSCRMTGEGETGTLAGTLPDNAWQNTSPADRTGVWYSGDVLNGYRSGVTAWDGASQSVTNLAGVVFTWAVEGSGTQNYGNLSSRTPAFRQAWLARASGTGEFTSVVVQNIPYEKYDVIVYVSGKADATDVRAVLINGVPYKGDSAAENSTRVASSNTSTWGNVGSDTLALGGNALKVTGLISPDLQVSMKNATTWGICAIQIVRDMSAGANNAQRATGKVISVNIQSAKNTSGYTTGDIGIVRVPAEAWTADGLALANNEANYDSDVNVAIKEWDGATGTTGELTGITLHEKVKNAYYYGASSYVPQPQVLSSYADDYNGSSWRGTFTVTGVPYKKYDVIVYCATDTENRYFGPVSVNGTPYRWSESNKATQEASSADSSDNTRWGFSQSRVMAYGGNAIRVTDQTSSTLVIVGANNNANNCRGGIAGFQIVDTYDPSAIPSVTIEDGGTLELSAAQETALRVICEGSFTVVGVNGYTVTNADLLKLDLEGVTGTVTLGANTCYELGANRTLPAGFVFGEGSSVAITETAEEYAKDLFSVSGLTGVSTVVLTRYDGTTETLTVVDGAATRGDGTDVKVTGSAALYDFTFTRTLATATGSRATATMGQDGTPAYDESSDGIGVVSTPAYPYIGISSMYSWTEFSTVVVGKMPSENKKCFISFGRGWDNMLFLATGSKANEVVVCYGNNSSVEVLATMTVPHAAESRHLYAFTISESKTILTIYLDGMKWKTVTRPAGFALATSSTTPGIQIGKGYATNPSGYGSASDGVFYSLLIYDYVLSEEQLEALKELYPYSPSAGSYSREVSGETTFATEANTWTKSGETSANYTVPADNAAMTLTAGADAAVTVNATLSAESLNLEGDGALTLKKGDGRLTSAGLTTIATEVTIEGGAADISGAPTVITEGGTLKFDYSAFDLFKYSAETLEPLTGELEQQAEGVVTCILPECDATREHTSEFLYTNGCYQLRVIPRAAKDVYLSAGVTEFTDDTEVTWTEGEEATEVTGYAIATDTVHFSAADTVTVNRTVPVVGYDFGEFAGKLVLSSGEAEELILSQTITGAGTVEIASGVVQSRGSFATDIDVASGAVLKLGSVGGFGATDNGVTPSGKTITVAGEVELNGVRDSCNAFTLVGGTLRNTGLEIPTGNRQTTALTLTANSTVHARSDFGLVASQYAATSLNLGGYTLTKTGDANFWLYNTRSEGAGTVDIQAGAIYVYSTASMPNVNFKVAEDATLKVRTDDFSAGTISGSGTVSIGQSRPTQALHFGSSLDVTIVLASTTEEKISIPYTGSQPKSVTVYEPSGNWDTECEAVKSVEYTDGKIAVEIEIANTRRANPAKDNDWATFTNVFRGTEDATWETPGDWYVVSNNRWSSYNGTIAPAKTNSNQWEPVLIDGDYVKLAPGQDGYKEVTSSALEGWNLRLGLYNGVRVTIGSLTKVQSGAGVTSIFMVDDSSQLVVAGRGNGNNGGAVDFYVAAKDGITFNTDFTFNKNGSNTVSYYLAGEGSVKYADGVTTGTHQIMAVKLPAGNPPSKLKKLIKRKLVSFGSRSNGNVTFSLGPTVTSLDKTPNGEPLAMSPYSGEGNLTTEADFGTYQLTQETDGVYITYVGYDRPFVIRLR